MELQKEIWINSVTEGLYADNTFAARSINHSDFVNDKTVHVPNAGAGPNVEKDRATLPATIAVRADNDLKYDIHEFTSDPIRIPHAETVELSYNKRESVVRVSRATLIDKVHKDLVASWITGAGTITPGATVKETVRKTKLQMDKDLVPSTGRNFMLTAEKYNQLLDELGDAAQNNFLVSADPARGILGKWMGFDFYMHELDGTQNGLAWWDQAVSRALGEVVMFEQEKSPEYFSDIISFLVRAGGAAIRKDAKGLLTF